MADGLGSLLDESDGDVVGTSTGLTRRGPYVANMLGKGAALAINLIKHTQARSLQAPLTYKIWQ